MAFGVMPIILFMSILISILFYLGAIPAFLRIIGGFVRTFVGITSPEALSVIGNMFFGQIETLMMIGPMLHRNQVLKILAIFSKKSFLSFYDPYKDSRFQN